MPGGKGKTVFVPISSSSDEEEHEEDDDDDEEEEEGDVDDSDYDDDDDDDDDDESGDDDSDDVEDDDDEDLISISSGEDVIDEETDCQSADDDSEVTPGDKHDCKRVTQLLQGGSDLNMLKLEECKAYLRKNGLRVTGTKSICIERIQEHWRIKDGNGEKLYPRSSFVINCTGDVCKGDVVLFTQRVYKKFDIVTKGGDPIGKRTIAGRIVKESYGAAKQQHTFTVEILWTKGVKRLPPLFPLLVKGRNLYRLKTFRQRWNDEAKRLKILAEKHKRGAAARQVRAIKKARSANGGYKNRRLPPKRQKKQADHSTKARNLKTSCGNGPSSGKPKAKRNSKVRAPESSGSKRKKHAGYTMAPEKKWKNLGSKSATTTHKCDIGQGKTSSTVVLEADMKRLEKPRSIEWETAHMQQRPHGNGFPAVHSIAQQGPPNNHYHMQTQLHRSSLLPAFASSRAMHPLSNYEIGSTSSAARVFSERATVVPTHYPVFNNVHHFSSAYVNSSSQVDPRSSSCLPTKVDFGKQLHNTVPCGVPTQMQKSGSLACPTPGCTDLGAKHCVGSLCWKCCKKVGWKCQRHKLP